MNSLESRTKKSMRNTAVAFATQAVSFLCSFAVRTIVIHYLGKDYLGLSAVFQNILGILSVAETGFATVILVSMYGPVAKNDQPKIRALLQFYHKIYLILACCVLAIGLCFLPWINQLSGNDPDVTGIQSVYVIIFYLESLIGTVCTYFFSYKRSLVLAYQDKYIDNLNTLIWSIIKNTLMAIAVIVLSLRGQNHTAFLVYLAITPCIAISENVAITILANKKYPIAKDGEKVFLSGKEKKKIGKDTAFLLLHKFSEAFINSTDSIIIAFFLGVSATGYYSNYLMLVTAATTVMAIPFAQISASIGNLVATGDKERVYLVFRRVMFAQFIFVGVATIGLATLTQNLISFVWLKTKVAEDPNYLLPWFVLAFQLLIFYIHMVREPIAAFKEVTKIFRYDWYFSIIRVFVNLIISIALTLLMKKYLGWQWGIVGDLIGTLTCYLATQTWEEPFFVFKYYFEKPVSLYFKDYLLYSAVTLVVGLFSFLSVCFIPSEFGHLALNALMFATKVLLVLMVSVGAYCAIYWKNQFFQYYKNMIKKKRKRRKQ